jgi:hypothetical protein
MAITLSRSREKPFMQTPEPALPPLFAFSAIYNRNYQKKYASCPHNGISVHILGLIEAVFPRMDCEASAIRCGPRRTDLREPFPPDRRLFRGIRSTA